MSFYDVFVWSHVLIKFWFRNLYFDIFLAFVLTIKLPWKNLIPFLLVFQRKLASNLGSLKLKCFISEKRSKSGMKTLTDTEISWGVSQKLRRTNCYLISDPPYRFFQYWYLLFVYLWINSKRDENLWICAVRSFSI